MSPTIKRAIFTATLIVSLNANSWTAKELGEELISPIKHTPEVLLIGGIGTLGALSVRNPHIDHFESSQHRRRPMGGYSKYGDYAGQLIPNALYVSYHFFQDTSEGDRRGAGMLKATLYSGLVTSAIKYSVRAPRPNDNDVRNSFPSGHSATIFTFSGYVMAEHGGWYGAGAMSLAVLCGYSRINDKMHRLHEVVAGATIGLAYGIGISRLQRKRLKGKEDTFHVTPIIDSNTTGLLFYKEF